MNTIQFIDELEGRYKVLADARRAATAADEALLRSKHALAEAERTLDALATRLQAEAPETCRNEVQRKAWALAGSAEAAETVAGLRAAHLENEARGLWARAYLKGADDLRRFVETVAQAAALPPGALPDLPALPELIDRPEALR